MNPKEQTGTDRNGPTADRSADREREEGAPSLQGSRNSHPDLLSLAEGVRRTEARPSQTAEGIGEGECATETASGGAVDREAGTAGCGAGKLLSPERWRCAVERAEHEYGMSERHACWLLGQWRGTQRYEPVHRLDEDALTQAIIAMAANYGRYGYRRITALLRRAGWQVGKDRVQRIWRREGLKVPQKQRPTRRL